MNDRQRLEAIIEVLDRYLPPDGPLTEHEAMNEIIGLVDPLPPAAPPFEPVEVTDEVCARVSAAYYDDGVLVDRDYAHLGRDMIAAVRAELGPTLGLVAWQEPSPEECARISVAYYDDEALVDRDHRHLGKDMFDAVRAVLGGEK